MGGRESASRSMPHCWQLAFPWSRAHPVLEQAGRHTYPRTGKALPLYVEPNSDKRCSSSSAYEINPVRTLAQGAIPRLRVDSGSQEEPQVRTYLPLEQISKLDHSGMRRASQSRIRSRTSCENWTAIGVITHLAGLGLKFEAQRRTLNKEWNTRRCCKLVMAAPMSSAQARVVLRPSVSSRTSTACRNGSSAKTKSIPKNGHPWITPDMIQKTNLRPPSPTP